MKQRAHAPEGEIMVKGFGEFTSSPQLSDGIGGYLQVGAVVRDASTRMRTIHCGGVIYLAPHTNPWFHWLAFVDGMYGDEGGCHHLSPMGASAVRLEVSRLGMDEASWSQVAMPPHETCPFERPRAMPPSLVYFVQAGHNGPIKIGTTTDVARRLMQLQIGSPEEIVVVGAIAGGGDLEDEWHQRFDRFRLRGEWFKPDADLLMAIAEVTRVSL